MVLPKGKRTFRLYSQNINGLKLDVKGGELTTIVEFIQTYQCDLVGFSELNLDVSKYAVRKIVADTLLKSFQATQVSMSTSEIPFEGFYKPGGTLTATFDHNTCRFQSKFADSMVRWSTISLSGKHGRIIHFVSVYQVVDKAGNRPFTAHQQQVSSLLLADRTISPRIAFIQDLFGYFRSIQSPTSTFIVMGDLNEIVGHALSGFSKLTREFDLVDIMPHFHPIDKEVATYSRGRNRLDYIFCSQSLLTSVRSCGIEPFNEHIFSDHRSLFVDWDVKTLCSMRNSRVRRANQD
jgi:exonuclease III